MTWNLPSKVMSKNSWKSVLLSMERLKFPRKFPSQKPKHKLYAERLLRFPGNQYHICLRKMKSYSVPRLFYMDWLETRGRWIFSIPEWYFRAFLASFLITILEQ